MREQGKAIAEHETRQHEKAVMKHYCSIVAQLGTASYNMCLWEATLM